MSRHSVIKSPFHFRYCILVIIKVGDDAEVLYFVTKSKAEMEEWIHAFREGIRGQLNWLQLHILQSLFLHEYIQLLQTMTT